MRLGGGDDSGGHPVGNGIVVEARGDLATVNTRNIVSTRSKHPLPSQLIED